MSDCFSLPPGEAAGVIFFQVPAPCIPSWFLKLEKSWEVLGDPPSVISAPWPLDTARF